MAGHDLGDRGLHLGGGVEAELDQGAGNPRAGIVAVLAGIEHDAAGGPANGLGKQILEQAVGRIDPLQARHILNVGRTDLRRHSDAAQLLTEPLSQRELEVLRLFQTELSGPEQLEWAQAPDPHAGPGQIRVFCQRWWSRLPLPLTDADRAGGYWWDIAMRQVEVSRTIVFTAPRHARGFFDALCTDNLDIGRPEQMQIVFGRRVRTPPPDGYRTRLLRSGDEVTLNAYFGHSRVKSYLKCGRAFRIETVVNDTADLGVARRLEHLPEIWVKARDVNRRMVDAFRVGQGCVLASPAFERVARPTLEEGRRAPALRFGDPRVMALVGALCAGLHVVAGFTNRSLRARVNSLLGVPYSMGQMSYDLRRLRMKGLITRLPRSNTYVLTPDGQRVAIFYTKLHNRLLRPLAAANDPPAPLPLRQALRVIDRHIDDYITEARMIA